MHEDSVMDESNVFNEDGTENQKKKEIEEKIRRKLKTVFLLQVQQTSLIIAAFERCAAVAPHRLQHFIATPAMVMAYDRMICVLRCTFRKPTE